jgi:cytochrome c oxidase assembly factor CtaG
MSVSLITGAIGILMVAGFLGFMVVWVPAIPLIIIVIGVMLLLIYDFVQTVRFGQSWAQRN